MLVKKVSEEKASKIIETRQPEGYFYCVEDEKIIGIDNRTGDAWTEEFVNFTAFINWIGVGRKIKIIS